MVAQGVTLEFSLPRGSISQVLRSGELGGGAALSAEGAPVEFAWHDTADYVLAAQGRAVCRTGSGWALEEVEAAPGRVLPPGCAARVVRTASSASDLGAAAPDSLDPIAAFTGTLYRTASAERTVVVLDGYVAAAGAEYPVCRVRFRGFSPELVASLAKTLALSVPAEPLSGFAVRCATGAAPQEPARAQIASGSVRCMAGTVVPSLAASVMFWCTRAAEQGAADADAVHRARVAIRRIRSALRLLHPATGCPDLLAAEENLKRGFARLGAVRDLDVFMAWCAAEVASAQPHIKAVDRVLETARRRRSRAWTIAHRHLGSAEWRSGLVLLAAAAALQPWAASEDEERCRVLDDDAASFGRAALRKARGKLLQTGPVEALADPELHALRRRCKRLRYAADLFAPLYPGKPARRFLRRLARVQDAMGHINDMAVAAQLASELGHGRLYAGGVVAGWAMASGHSARLLLGRDWKRLAGAEPFWTKDRDA